MTLVQNTANDQRMLGAVTELQASIRTQYPDAQFELTQGDDPVGTYLWTTVDTDDPDGILDLVGDRLLVLQIDQEIPLYVIPVRTLERVLTTLEHPAKGHLDLDDILFSAPA